MFENLDKSYLSIIYLGLKSLFDKKEYWGECFHNADPGHPVYFAGADRKKGWEHADSPERNHLYIMLLELSNLLRKEAEAAAYVWWYDFKDWKAFCEYAIQRYQIYKN
jgi:hypothetical protein